MCFARANPEHPFLTAAATQDPNLRQALDQRAGKFGTSTPTPEAPSLSSRPATSRPAAKQRSLQIGVSAAVGGSGLNIPR